MSSLIPPNVAALASKVLGYGVVAGATFVKIPQILKIYNGKSGKGLSKEMFESELLGYTLLAISAMHRKLAFNAWGEYSFLWLQTLVIIALLYKFDPPPAMRTAMVWGPYMAVLGAFAAGMVTDELAGMAQMAANLVFWAARLPQLYSNFQAKSTGALSLPTCVLNTAGNAVRVLTTLQEGGGRGMLVGCAVGTGLNALLVLQILLYGGGKPQRGAGPSARARSVRAKKAE